MRMARQDQANDQFSLTSFLYGGNADYIEELQARYEDDPHSVDPEWQEFFARSQDDADDVRKNAEGASWAKPQLAGARPMANWFRRSTAIGACVEKHFEKKVKDKAAANGAGAFRRRRAAGDARFGARHHDDPRLPHARPSARQSRSARARQAARGLQRTVAGGLRLHRGRLRPADLHRQGAGARIRDHPRRCWTS